MFAAYSWLNWMSNSFRDFALQAFCEIVFTGVSAMEVGDRATSGKKEELRLLAVLALLKGEPAAQVCRQYNICHSDLYKFRHRALAAMRLSTHAVRRGSLSANCCRIVTMTPNTNTESGLPPGAMARKVTATCFC